MFSRFFQCFLRVFFIRYLERFHFTHSNVETIHSETLMECLSFLISTQQNVDLNHCMSLMSQMLENNLILQLFWKEMKTN